MKRLLDGTNSIDDLKKAFIQLKENEDKRLFYLFIGVSMVLLLAIAISVIYFVKKSKSKSDDEYWDDEWDDEFEYDDDDDCTSSCECQEYYNDCTDGDFDKSVKVEKL